jgi:hypothetical protein
VWRFRHADAQGDEVEAVDAAVSGFVSKFASIIGRRATGSVVSCSPPSGVCHGLTSVARTKLAG